jgi:hypothetical protein
VFDDFDRRVDSPSEPGRSSRTRQESDRRFGGWLLPRLLRTAWRSRHEPETDPITRFRRSGEVNQWLYDHFSLGTLLRETGFTEVRRMTYATSDIPEWERFDLDRSTAGDHPIEPSLYMEARRDAGRTG